MIEKEALAIVFGIKKFHQYLFGFTLVTDHKPLTLLLGPKRGIPVLASQNHANADALSRFPRKTIEETHDWTHKADEVNHVQMERIPITALKIHEVSRGDPVLSRVVRCVLHGWPVETAIPEELKIYY